MWLFRNLAGGLACLALLGATIPANERADDPPPRSKPVAPRRPSPLRFIPAEADILAEVPSPRRLVDTILALDALKQAQTFPAAKELLTGTQARRGKQLLAYFEKELGAKWPELLDRLAGGGIAAGAKFGDKAPFVVAVQAKDEAFLKKFIGVALTVVEGELARAESKDKPVKGEYRGIETIRLGKELFIGRAGAALVVSNKDVAFKRALDLHLGVEKNSLANSPLIAEADKLLPRGALARGWINLKVAHDSPQGKALYKSPRDDVNLTILLGSLFDVIGRSPFVTVGVYPDKDGFLTTVRMPRGRTDMGNDRLLHVPPAGQPGSRPLLEPKGVLYSQSFYLDLAAFWKEREKLFPKKVADNIGAADKGSGRFLAGAKLSTLLTSTGPYHRVVAVNQTKSGYKRRPKQAIPAFAFIPELREPDKFARSMDTVLRAGALFATTQFKLSLVEEKYKGVDLVAYRFDEKEPLKQDVNDIRFNFSPCYARVGNQFLFCSTIELGRELIDLLQKEQKSPAAGHPASSRIKLFGAGGAELLKDGEDQLVTQIILDQAVPPGEAREQVRALIAFVRQFGSLRIEETVLDNELRYEFRTGK